MFRTIIFSIQFVFSTLALNLTVFSLRRSKEDKLRVFAKAHETAAKWAKTQLARAGVKLDIRGIDNVPSRNVVFIGNHQSYADIPIMLAAVPDKPKGFVAKTELNKVPVAHSYMPLLGCVLMDRNDIKKSAKALTDATNLVKDGHSMVIYPEGTRSKTMNEMVDWKAGSFKLATRAGAPVVPVTIYNSRAILEGSGYKIKRRTDVVIVFHEPIETEGLTREEITELPEKVRNIVGASLKAVAAEKSAIDEK